MKSQPRFASLLNSMDPQLTKEGKPYGPERFRQIVKECYLIAKNCNTSYTDLMKITPIEKNYLLEFIAEEVKRSQELIEKNKSKNKNYKTGRR